MSMLSRTDEELLKIIKDNSLSYEEKCKKAIEEDLVQNYNENPLIKNKGCPLCNYKGFYRDLVPLTSIDGKPIEGEMSVIARECECEKIKQREKRRERATIPYIYKDIRLKDVRNVYSTEFGKKQFETTKKGLNKMLNEIEKYIANGEGVGIYGKTRGAGKSYILVAFANELIDKGYEVRYVNQIELLAKIKASWDREKGEQREEDILQDLKECDCLFIDDFGFNGNADWLDNRMYELLNYRYENKKPLYYTSNCSIIEMKFDERITSRLKQMVSEIEYAQEDLRENDIITGKENIFE